MKKKSKVLLSLIIVFTMIFTMGISSVSEIVDELVNKQNQENEVELLTEEESKTVSEDVYEEDLPEEPEDIIIGEEEKTVSEDVYEEKPIEQIGSPSIDISVTTDKELYENGDNLIYNIVLVNDGEVDLKDISIFDDLNGEYSVDSLLVGEEKIITKQYLISPDNNVEGIVNNIYVSTIFNEEEIFEETSFKILVNKENELAENIPPMIGEPNIVLPDLYYQGMKKMMSRTLSSELIDTIEVDKTAARIEGCRTFEVTLDIFGEPQEAPVDVVLVIDRSGSMNEGEGEAYVPIDSSPNTNESYYVKVNGEYRVVSYNSSRGWRYDDGFWIFHDYKYVNWNPNGDDISPGSNNSNTPIEKPFYQKVGTSRLYYAKQAAINFAAKVLGPNGISGSRVSVVSFSGPQYTDDYGNQNQASTDLNLSTDLTSVFNAINNISASGGTNTEAGFIQAKNVIQGSTSLQNPNSNKVVIMFTDGIPTASNGNQYGPSEPTSHNNHTIAAYTAGQDIWQNAVADVFTIGLLQNMNTSVKDLAIDTLTLAQNKGFYEAPTPQDLDQIFTEISNQLGYSATNAVVVDKIGDDFELVAGSLPSGASYNSSTREITWSPGTIVSHAQLKYTVKAKQSFPGGLADTNEYANLTYTDVNGNTNQTKTFPVPQVNVPEPLNITLTDASIIIGNSIDLGAGTNSSGENYMSPITGGDGDGTYTYEWREYGDNAIFSTDKNPTVSPIEDITYELTVIDSNGCKARAIMTVTVEDPKGSITITKIVEDPRDEDTNLEFDIFVNGPNGTQYVITLKNGESQTLENLELGEYTVSEIVPMNYELVGISNSNITLTQQELDASTTVTNKPDNDGWFHDDDPLINSFTIGIVEQNEQSQERTSKNIIETKIEAILPNDPEEDTNP